MTRCAILQVADTGPLESLVTMLVSAGYRCLLPSRSLRTELRRIGCDTVLDIDDLVRGMGYDLPFSIPETTDFSMQDADLYVDVKAHRNYTPVVQRWPRLNNKVLWYRINGGKPEHVTNQYGDMGDEVSPPCPALTPNQWYKDYPRAYTCWPPFVRFNDYFDKWGRGSPPFTSDPVCLLHNAEGWGYGALIQSMRERGVQIYGRGSPDGLISHKAVPKLLSNALCMVHLKSSDAPGYALYEAMAAACPIICTRRLIWRCKMEELLIPNETCLVFDRETHDGLTAEDVYNCTMEVGQHLQRLQDPKENIRIGSNAYHRLQHVMWSAARDGAGFCDWMRRMFP